APGSTAPAASSGASIPTAEEAQEFALSLESAVAEGSQRVVESMFDFDAMLTTATEGFEVPDKDRRAFIKGATESMRKPTGFIPQILAAVANDQGTYRFLRTRPSKRRMSVLFRLQLEAGGLNYHDLILARRPDGAIRVVDVYVFL